MKFQKFKHDSKILILFVFVSVVLFSGCTEVNERAVGNSSDETPGQIEVKCGIVNELCCENNTCNSNLSCVENRCMNFKVANISTENPKYAANQQIKISVNINSTSDVNNVSLRVYGITSRQKNHLIDKTINLNLTQGINIRNFTVNAPACTHGCGAKYYPGDYPLYAEILYKDEINNISISDGNQIMVNLY